MLAPAIFALKVSFSGLTQWIAGTGTNSWNRYYAIIANLPSRLVLVVIPLLLFWWSQKTQTSFWGLTTKNFTWQPYALMLLIMVPLITFASTQADFLHTYPKLNQVAFVDNITNHPWWYKTIYEISYGIDFLTIELFFRGFLVFAFVRYAGADAVLPMAVFYCSIHFGKPLFECISSFFGGMLLGIIAYRTQSILGGIMVHLGIAWMMEAGGYIGNLYRKKDKRSLIFILFMKYLIYCYSDILFNYPGNYTFTFLIFLISHGVKNNYQLISRILFLNYHLSGPGITARILLPTLQHRADSPQALVYVALQHARFTHAAHYYAAS